MTDIIKRTIYQNISQDLFHGKVLILVGPRQTGKTTLINKLLHQLNLPTTTFNGDDFNDVKLLSEAGLTQLQPLIANSKLIFIDEAQKIPNIGNIAKLIVDNFHQEKQLILTGSSSINLLNHTQEPLTGRKFTHHLFPFTAEEILQTTAPKTLYQSLDKLLIYGTYPAIFTQPNPANKQREIQEIASSYLYQDILSMQLVKNPLQLTKLLQALALQIGSLVSYNELANLIGLSKNTVLRYIDLLEKNFVIFRLNAYNLNPRHEISRAPKIYFWDTGIRNALIADFRSLDLRSDVGQLWENFVIAEFAKLNHYYRLNLSLHFWRSYSQSEIDLILSQPDHLQAFEIKWNTKKTIKPPRSFISKHPHTQFQIINPSNFLSIFSQYI